MRTTVTLDPDVERLIDAVKRRTHRSFKVVLNDALRRGLASGGTPAPKPFQVEAENGRLRAGIDDHRFNQLVDEMEAEASVGKR
jgi:predicted transcriptional regulator